MEIARGMDVMEARDDLAEDRGDEATCKWPAFASFDEVIEIAFHAFKNKVQLLRIWQEEEVIEGNDARMKGDCAKRLHARNMSGQGSKKDKGADLEFLEFFTLIPATFPLLFHPLDSDETFSCPFRTSATTTLHGRERSTRR